MTLTVSADSNNDLFIGADGSLALVSGIEAVLQAAQQAAQTQLGEMVFATDQGIPNFQTVWNGAPNLSQFEAYLRRALLAVDGVVSVLDLVTTQSNNALSYRVTIQTIYGPGAFTNE